LFYEFFWVFEIDGAFVEGILVLKGGEIGFIWD
jgi:hypothetical protein